MLYTFAPEGHARDLVESRDQVLPFALRQKECTT